MFRIDRSAVGKIDKKNPFVLEDQIIEEAAPEPLLSDEDFDASDDSPEQAEVTAEQIRAKAQEILESAQQKAQQLIDEANEQASAIREDAWKSGFDQGGQEAALVLKKLRKDDLASIQKLADDFEQSRLKLIEESEFELLGVAIETARKIVNHELNNPAVYMSFLSNALDKIRFEGKVKLYLDSASYERFIREYGENPIARDTFQIVATENPSMGQDSAIVAFGGESIDLSVDKQIAVIRAELGLA